MKTLSIKLLVLIFLVVTSSSCKKCGKCQTNDRVYEQCEVKGTNIYEIAKESCINNGDTWIED